MALGYALFAAAAYGCSDFIGGLLARRASAWGVAVVVQLVSALSLLMAAPFLGGSPARQDWLFAVTAGIGVGVGVGFLFRGLSAGAMGVVAPLSAVGSAFVPVGVGIIIGERPGPWALVGIALAFPAIWLVASTKAEVRQASSTAVPPGVIDGVIAGLGFGSSFALLAQMGADAGVWPLVGTQLTAAVTAIVIATVLRAAWVPDRIALRAAPAGPLGAAALTAFILAERDGLLSVTAVAASLYPAFTVLLAVLILRERVMRTQAAGLALCLLAVACMAL